MKKCPSCYAYMKETLTPADVPKMKQKPAHDVPGIAAARVRYECGQCGHVEEEFAAPAAVRRA